jgi:hypothetical protein
MIERTQKKLREAIFFLTHLEQVTGSDPREAAEYYLSAFLSAARSVTFVLESEEPEIYSEWSRAWRASLTDAERQLLAKFTGARNRALKRETPAVTEDQITQATRSGLSPELLFFFEVTDEDYGSIGPKRLLRGRFSPQHAEEELIPTCRAYVALLSKEVADFMASRGNA